MNQPPETPQNNFSPPQGEPRLPFAGAPGGSATPPPPPPPSPHPPFGGGPVGPPQPPRKSRRGLYTCLVVVLGGGALCVFLLFIGARVLESMVDMGGIQMPLPKSEDTIGLLRIENVILNEEKVLEVIRRYKELDNVKAVLVRINSPGGSVGASQEIYEGIKSLKRDGKKVVVSMGNVAASGGYYIACAADKIYTNPGTLTGSIGVIMSVPNLEKISEKIGIDQVVIKSGKLKDVPSYTRQMTEEERAYLQNVIDDTYNQFLEAILEFRTEPLTAAMEEIKAETDPEKLRAFGPGVQPPPGATAEDYLRQIADGRVMSGRQAVALGLVDAVGTREDALDALAEMLGIEAPDLYEYKPKRTLFDVLSSGAESAIQGVGLPLRNARLEYRMPY